MKVSREQASKNRKRIVDVAGQLFCERGFDGIGVADLMKAAGLTHGGFYGHFGSKEDLAAEASAEAMKRAVKLWPSLIEGSPSAPMVAIARNYLSELHRDSPGKGCAVAALGPDASRQGGAVKRAFTDGLERQLEILQEVSPGRTKAQRRKAALALLAQMVGALMLARLVDDEKLSKDILEAALSAITTASVKQGPAG